MESNNDLENKDNNAKINLLKQEITDKNYNQIDFINFCLSKKENGDNLESWTLQELSNLIKEFILNKRTKGEKVNMNNKYNNYEISKELKEEENINIENEIEEIGKVNLFKENSNKKGHKSKIKKNKKEKIVKCQLLEKTVLNYQNITINIKDLKEVNGGIFSKNYIIYIIETKPLGWIVQRRFSDFELLRKLLVKHYPFHRIEPLPNKKFISKQFDKDFNNKRINILDNFLNSIIKNESFKASEIIVSFLSLEDRNKFDNKFKELNNQITGEENVDDYKTLNGEIALSYDEKNENYFKNIQKYLKLQDETFIKLNQSLKIFNKNISSVCGNIDDIINNLSTLYNINSNVSMKETITNSFEELQNLFKGWKKILISQNNLIKNRIKKFFKLINLSNNVFKEIIGKREELNTKFNSENTKLRFKKEKLYIIRDINKYEIEKDIYVDNQRLIKDKKYAFNMMCTNETKNVSKIYKLLGYANKMAEDELKEMLKENSNKFIDNFINFGKEFVQNIKDFSEIWNKFELFLNDIKEKNEKNKNKIVKESNKNNISDNNIINNYNDTINNKIIDISSNE